MIVWGRVKDIQREVANVPLNWLARFAIARPGDIRYLGEAQNSTTLYRASAVLEAVESGELKRAYNYGKEVSQADVRPAASSSRKEGK